MGTGAVLWGDPRLPPRFWAKVTQHPVTGCWVWTAACDHGGYGRVHWQGRQWGAHRLAYVMLVGEIPPGMQIDHVKAQGCTSRACVNPAHLEPVTCRENLLRGDTWQAANAAKTECPYGHPYDEVNTYVRRTGGRGCRTCLRERKRLRTYRK